MVHGDDDAVAYVEEEFVGHAGFTPGDMDSYFRVVVWVVGFGLCGGIVEADVEAVVEGDHGFPVSVCVLDGLNVYVSVRVWQVVWVDCFQPERSEGFLWPVKRQLADAGPQTPQAARNL